MAVTLPARCSGNTYTAAALQRLDRGAPVAPYTVARELGHSGTAMIEKVYGHLGQIRYRSEVVEFRVEQHPGALQVAMRRE